MDFFDFAEAWAVTRPDIQHVKGKDSKNKRYFLTLGFANMVDFLQTQTAKSSPSVIIESGVPISGKANEWTYKDYTIYFCVRSPQQLQTLDGAEARKCKKEAECLAQDFIHDAIAFNREFGKNGIQVENDFQIETFGPFFNWWYASQLSVRVGESPNVCKDNITNDILKNL